MTSNHIEQEPHKKTLGEQIFEYLKRLSTPISSSDLARALGIDMQNIRQAAQVYNNKASQKNHTEHIRMEKQGRVMFYSIGNREAQVPYHLQDDIRSAVETALSRKRNTKQSLDIPKASLDAYALAYLSLLLNPELDLSSLTRYSLSNQDLFVFTLESENNLRGELAGREYYQPELFMDSLKAILQSNTTGLKNLYLILIHNHKPIEALAHKEKWNKTKAKNRITNANTMPEPIKKIYLYLIDKTDNDGNLLWTDRELQDHANALQITKAQLQEFLGNMSLEWEILDVCVLKRKSFHKREYEYQFILTNLKSH